MLRPHFQPFPLPLLPWLLLRRSLRQPGPFAYPTHMTKISIRFFDDREVRAVWDEEQAKWWFSVLDIVAVLTDQDDYEKTRNY